MNEKHLIINGYLCRVQLSDQCSAVMTLKPEKRIVCDVSQLSDGQDILLRIMVLQTYGAMLICTAEDTYVVLLQLYQRVAYISCGLKKGIRRKLQNDIKILFNNRYQNH